MDILPEAVRMIDILQTLVAVSLCSLDNHIDCYIPEFVSAAGRFILTTISITSAASLQLYVSGVVFSTEQSGF